MLVLPKIIIIIMLKSGSIGNLCVPYGHFSLWVCQVFDSCYKLMPHYFIWFHLPVKMECIVKYDTKQSLFDPIPSHHSSLLLKSFSLLCSSVLNTGNSIILCVLVYVLCIILFLVLDSYTSIHRIILLSLPDTYTCIHSENSIILCILVYDSSTVNGIILCVLDPVSQTGIKTSPGQYFSFN